MVKIEILETEKIESNGELFNVPVKVAIDGREYVCQCEDITARICGLSIEEIEELKLGDIPENLEFNIDTDIGLLKLRFCYASLEIAQKPKYWRNNILISNFFMLLRRLGLKNGFEVVSEGEDENLYFIELARVFPEETKTVEAFGVFKKFVDRIDSVVKVLNTLVDGVLSIILRTEPISSFEGITK